MVHKAFLPCFSRTSLTLALKSHGPRTLSPRQTWRVGHLGVGGIGCWWAVQPNCFLARGRGRGYLLGKDPGNKPRAPPVAGRKQLHVESLPQGVNHSLEEQGGEAAMLLEVSGCRSVEPKLASEGQ